MSDTLKEDKLLRSAVQWQYRPRSYCCRADNEAAGFLARHKRRLQRNAALVDAWEAIVPPGLKPWCRLDSVAGQVLTIQAAPGPYMHQIQIMQYELLAELRRQCPAAGIRKLRVIPLKETNEDL